MSKEEDKIKHSKRLHQEENAIKKQIEIAKQHGLVPSDKAIKEPHRLAKHHAMDCGNPDCIMCGNPRKVFKERTYQEMKQHQNKVVNDMGDD